MMTEAYICLILHIILNAMKSNRTDRLNKHWFIFSAQAAHAPKLLIIMQS